jgi:hypothetical protein
MNARDHNVVDIDKKHDNQHRQNDFREMQVEYYQALCQRDLSEAVINGDTNRLMDTMVNIGTDARKTHASGDLDEKISFVDRVFDRIEALVTSYANAAADADLEQMLKRGEFNHV